MVRVGFERRSVRGRDCPDLHLGPAGEGERARVTRLRIDRGDAGSLLGEMALVENRVRSAAKPAIDPIAPPFSRTERGAVVQPDYGTFNR